MKKPAIMLLATGVSLTSLATVPTGLIHAEDSDSKTEKKETQQKSKQISKQKALKIAENFFNVKFEKPQYRYDQNWYRTDTSVWNVEFNHKGEDGETTVRYSITVDAINGDILETRYHLNQDQDESFSYPPKVNWEEGKTKAHRTVLNYFPDIKQHVKFDKSKQPKKPSLSDGVIHTYQYTRMIDETPFPNNYIHVRVNGNNEVVSFSSRWNPEIALDPQSVELSKKEALKEFTEKQPVELQYDTLNRYYRSSREDAEKMVLAYDLNESFPYLDATSGDWINRQGKSMKGQLKTETITEKPLEPIRMIKSIMKEKEAKGLVEQLVNIPENMDVHNVEYDQNDYQPTTWEFSYSDPNEDGKEYEKKSIRVRINATTGEILSYNLNDRSLYEDQEDKEVKVDYKTAKERAIEYVKTFAPSKADNVFLKTNTDNSKIKEDVSESKRYSFNFQRQKDSIQVRQDSIRVSLSATTGELIRFNQRWQNDVSFPSADDVISKEEAFQRFLERFEVQLGWKGIQDLNEDGKPGEKTYNKVYFLENMNVFDQSVYLNAKTGEWHAESDGERVFVKREATDIEGLPQEQALELMISYGAIPVGDNGEAHPHEPITRGEMVKMLMLANNPDPRYYDNMAMKYSEDSASFNDVEKNSEYFSYVEEALRQGYLDKENEDFNPDELVNRLELAKLIVHALEYDELASNTNMFNQPYNDITSEEAAGFVSIVHYLEIMTSNEEDQLFNPDQNIDRANAAQIFFNYLKARSSLD